MIMNIFSQPGFLSVSPLSFYTDSGTIFPALLKQCAHFRRQGNRPQGGIQLAYDQVTAQLDRHAPAAKKFSRADRNKYLLVASYVQCTVLRVTPSTKTREGAACSPRIVTLPRGFVSR